MRRAGATTIGWWLAASVALAAAPASAQDLSFLDVPARPRASGPAPSEEMERGLAELGRELGRFEERARGYRRAVDRLLSARARAERRALMRRYASALRDERRLEGQARARAIAALERFVARHPDAPRHTPDALMRLAELHLAAPERDDAELEAAIGAARRIVTDFGGYRAVDRAAYLLGWALDASGRAAEAVEAWRAFVCANRAPEGAAEPHPAGDRRPSYDGCRSARPSDLAAEMWLRIGEHHFDAGELAEAEAAYRRVVEHPEDRFYGFGLYKLAWTHYRSARYPEAIERFVQLVRYSDAVRERTGAAGSELREEAIQYVALALTWDDWDEDGRPDHTQGGAHPLERLEDSTLWPHDAPFAAEVYRRVGDVLFELGHPDEAIVAWRLRLSSYPPGCDAADVHLSILRAQRQQGDDAAVLATLERLADAGSGTSWGDVPCPGGLARISDLARQAQVDLARTHHRRAQELRRRGRLDSDRARLEAANAAYARAVQAYRRALERYPSDPAAYRLTYDLAEALYWSGRYEAAARAYAEVRDSPLDDRLLARAARRVVEAESRRLEAAIRQGRVTPREDPPPTRGGAPHHEPVPEALQRVARAREIYLRWVRPSEDAEHVRDAYAFNNARMLYLHGYWDRARRRFEALYAARCRGSRAAEIGRDAWLALREIAVRREALSEIEGLTRSLRERGCTFAPGGTPVVARGCGGDGSLACEVEDLEARVRFRRLREEADAVSAESDGARRRRRARSVASRLVQTVDRHPSHPQSAAALLRAARLLDQEARRPASAARVYQRVVDTLTPETAAEMDVVAEAHFQLARAAQRAFDYERALASYQTIVDSDRFRGSDAPSMLQRRRDALVNAALLSARLGRHEAAARTWSGAAELLPPSEAREARRRAAEELLEAGRADDARRAIERWIEGGATVRAFGLLARALEALGDEDGRRRALRAAVAAHHAQGSGASAPEAEVAARAALALAQGELAALPEAEIAPGVLPSMDAFAAALRRQTDEEMRRTRAVLDAYEVALGIGRPEVSVIALERQGAIYERLVRAVLATEVAMPRDLARRLRRAPPGVRREARAQLEDATRGLLDELVRPLECRAIERYLLAARLSRRASIPSTAARRAFARLAAYGRPRVATCVEAARRRDRGFAPLGAGELERARAGVHPTPDGPLGPGGFAPD